MQQLRNPQRSESVFERCVNKYPKLSLVLDIEKDIENAVGFLTYEKNPQFLGWFFSRRDIRALLEGASSMKEKKGIIPEYTKRYFAEHGSEIKRGLRDAIRDWKKIEKGYYALADVIFAGHPWPKGEYTGAVSIYTMYPRWIETRTFFFPYVHRKPQFANRVIAHEMLHFMFFDYIFRRYGLREQSKIKGREADYVWKVSEAFNTMIERWQPYKNVIGYDGGKPYPGQEEMYKKMRRQWAKKQDVAWLLDQWFEKKGKVA